MGLQKITFAGHSAVFFEITDANGAECTIAIDPWLESNPICPPALKKPKKIDLILLTHGHADHAGEAGFLAKHFGATVAATWELAMILGKEGVPEQHLIPMNKGGTIDFRGVKVSMTHALHSSSYDTPTGAIYAGEAGGFVVDDGTTPVYHAGDTCLFSDISLIGKRYHPKIAILPIGDRFTMGPEEAAEAARLVGCKIAIPIHYKTFPMLVHDASQFKKSCAGMDIEVVVLEPGESYSVKR